MSKTEVNIPNFIAKLKKEIIDDLFSLLLRNVPKIV